MDNYLSKSKSNSIKFITVLLMIFFHTFDFPDRVMYEYIPLCKIGGIPIKQYIASVVGICVECFFGGQFLFVLGIIIAKYSIFEKIKIKINFSRNIHLLVKAVKE